MTGKRLFVIKEAGSAAFCVPLWRSWLETPPPFEWSVLANPAAYAVIQKELNDAPVTQSWGIRPDLAGVECVIASATGDAFEASFLDHSGRFIQFIDAPYNAERRIAEGLETLLVIHGCVKSQVQNKVKKVHVIGHPVWEETAHTQIQIGPSDRWVFVAQPISQIPELVGLGYNEHIVWDLLCEAQRRFPEHIRELVYCPHLAQTSLPENACFLKDNETALTTGGTMVGMYSALMVEGYLAGQNVLSWQPCLAEHDRCFLSILGLVPLVTSDEPSSIMSARQTVGEADLSFLDGALKRFSQVCGA